MICGQAPLTIQEFIISKINDAQTFLDPTEVSLEDSYATEYQSYLDALNEEYEDLPCHTESFLHSYECPSTVLSLRDYIEAEMLLDNAQEEVDGYMSGQDVAFSVYDDGQNWYNEYLTDYIGSMSCKIKPKWLTIGLLASAGIYLIWKYKKG